MLYVFFLLVVVVKLKLSLFTITFSISLNNHISNLTIINVGCSSVMRVCNAVLKSLLEIVQKTPSVPKCYAALKKNLENLMTIFNQQKKCMIRKSKNFRLKSKTIFPKKFNTIFGTCIALPQPNDSLQF